MTNSEYRGTNRRRVQFMSSSDDRRALDRIKAFGNATTYETFGDREAVRDALKFYRRFIEIKKIEGYEFLAEDDKGNVITPVIL